MFSIHVQLGKAVDLFVYLTSFLFVPHTHTTAIVTANDRGNGNSNSNSNNESKKQRKDASGGTNEVICMGYIIVNGYLIK